MKTIILKLIIGCCVLNVFPLHADMSEMIEIMAAELQQKSLTAVSKKNNVETYSVTYKTATDGSIMHFGIWTDCIIGTVVANASNVGLQAIMLSDGSIYDQSSKFQKKKDCFVNEYSWGKVTSWDHKQSIESK